MSECIYCGGKHAKQEYPARGKVCFKCKKHNHYARMCRSTSVHDVQQKVNEPKLEDNDFFIGTIDHEGGAELLVDLVVQDSHTVTVKLETGAQVNVMPLTVYKALGKDPKKLKPTNTNLTAYGGNKIEVLGCCNLKSRYKDRVRVLKFYVVTACAPCALSLKACQDLVLIKVVLAVNTNCYMSLTMCLLDKAVHQEYSIQLNPEVQPVVHAARKIPVALREKVKAELDRMESLNVISKVDEPTQWVNSMVVVPKPNGTENLFRPKGSE